MKKEEHGGDIEIRRMPQVWTCAVEIGWNTWEWGVGEKRQCED